MKDEDRAYYEKRLIEERALVEALTDPSSRAIHLELANRYEAALRVALSNDGLDGTACAADAA